MSRIANNALLGGGVRVRVWIREQRKIKGRSKTLLSLCWQSWTSLGGEGEGERVYIGRERVYSGRGKRKKGGREPRSQERWREK